MPEASKVAGAIEVNLKEIPEGKVFITKCLQYKSDTKNIKAKTFDWRGKPLFVKHRTAEEVAIVRSVPLTELRDPEPDEKVDLITVFLVM